MAFGFISGPLSTKLDRRRFLQFSGGAIAGAAFGGITLVPNGARAADAKIVVKYDWLIGNGQIGDVVAVQKGFFKEQGFEVEFIPGGPNSSTVPPVTSGQAQLGQFSGSSQLLVARGSGVPVKLIAAGYRRGPFTYFSLPRAPIRTPADMVGKRIGTQPTARFTLDAILAKNKIDPSSLTITNIGFDLSPLVSGDVDAVSGFITNTEALAVIGPDRIDLSMAAAGVPDYANAYFATDEAVETNADVLARFIHAVAKGWGWTYENPEEAVEITVKAYPALNLEIEKKTIKTVLDLSFDKTTKSDGWGTFDTALLQEQIDIFTQIGQFAGEAPKLDDVYTKKILDLTAGERPKLG